MSSEKQTILYNNHLQHMSLHHYHFFHSAAGGSVSPCWHALCLEKRLPLWLIVWQKIADKIGVR